MSGVAPDPLDRIAERWQACHEDVLARPYGHPIACGWYHDDVLALVEIARAARDVVEFGPRQGTLMSLRVALARLEGAA